MGLYARHIGPRFVRCLCCGRDIAAERRKIVPRAEGVVLEIGIGPGLNLPYYDPARVERVVGVDPGEAFVRLGREAVAASPVPVTIAAEPAERIPLPSASVDTAVVTFTLCSVDDPEAALGEIGRVLRPDGRVLFLEHGRSDDPGVARWQDRLNPVWRALAVGCNLNRPVAGLLEAAGFAIQEIEEAYMPGVPRPVGFYSRGVARPGR